MKTEKLVWSNWKSNLTIKKYFSQLCKNWKNKPRLVKIDGMDSEIWQLPIVYKPTLKPTIYLSSYIMSNYIKMDHGKKSPEKSIETGAQENLLNQNSRKISYSRLDRFIWSFIEILLTLYISKITFTTSVILTVFFYQNYISIM